MNRLQPQTGTGFSMRPGDLLTVVDEVVVEGDRAAIRWHSTGSHEHSFLGVPATKREVAVSGATFARFEDDRIVEEHVTWDPRALLTALGIIAVASSASNPSMAPPLMGMPITGSKPHTMPMLKIA